jgi:hypothetical protein
MKNTIIPSASSLQMNQALLCWISQMFCCVALLAQMKKTIVSDPFFPTISVVLIRFICGLVLHSYQNIEIMSGMKNMKFAINHAYRFTNWYTAFASGFMQASVAFLIEVTNLLVILTSSDELGVVMNFMALTVIASFDDYFYVAQGESILKDVINNPAYGYLYTIKTTNSTDATLTWPTFPEHILTDKTLEGDDQNNPEYYDIKVSFDGRPVKRMLRWLYQAFRMVQVLWFYYFPWLVLILSYLIPFVLNQKQKDAK